MDICMDGLEKTQEDFCVQLEDLEDDLQIQKTDLDVVEIEISCG
jgi:hypothetical protein